MEKTVEERVKVAVEEKEQVWRDRLLHMESAHREALTAKVSCDFWMVGEGGYCNWTNVQLFDFFFSPLLILGLIPHSPYQWRQVISLFNTELIVRETTS